MFSISIHLWKFLLLDHMATLKHVFLLSRSSVGNSGVLISSETWHFSCSVSFLCYPCFMGIVSFKLPLKVLVIIFLEVLFFSLKCLLILVSVDVIFAYLCIWSLCLFIYKFAELVWLTDISYCQPVSWNTSIWLKVLCVWWNVDQLESFSESMW